MDIFHFLFPPSPPPQGGGRGGSGGGGETCERRNVAESGGALPRFPNDEEGLTGSVRENGKRDI